MSRVLGDQDRGGILIDVIERRKGTPDGTLVILFRFDRLDFLDPSFLSSTVTNALPGDVVNRELENVRWVFQGRVIA